MSLPFRRRGRPKGSAGLTPVPDIPDSSEADTERWLSQIRPDDYDGRTWRDASGAATPAGVTPIAIKQAGQDTEPLARYRTRPRYRPPAPAAPEPPAPRPPAIRPLAPELPPHEGLPAVQVTAMLGAIRYPGADGTPEDYAAVMRHWSHLTGTVSGLESPGAWPRHAIAGTAARTAAS